MQQSSVVTSASQMQKPGMQIRKPDSREKECSAIMATDQFKSISGEQVEPVLHHPRPLYL